MIAGQGAFDPSTRPLRVLWLIKGLGAGGAERLLVQSARHRDPAVVQPAVAYLLAEKSTLTGRLRELGCEPVECLGARSSWDPRWVLRLRRMLVRERFDVVHVHSPLVAVGYRLAARSVPRRFRPRTVVTEHNVWSSHAPLTRLADRLTARPEEVHLAVSTAVSDSLPGPIRARTRVLRYGIEADEVAGQAGNRAAMRAELGIADGEVLVGTVANLRATKGYPDLLAAAREVRTAVPSVRFVAVGRGPMEAELRARHRELGLDDRFRFLGFRKDAVAVMSAFDVFCLPSRFEGLPVVLMEALALGLPIVATDVGGVAELVDDGKEAVLVPAGEPHRLAAALLAVATDPDRRSTMARLARERGSRIGAGGAVREIEAVYREIVGQ